MVMNMLIPTGFAQVGSRLMISPGRFRLPPAFSRYEPAAFASIPMFISVSEVLLKTKVNLTEQLG
jgi:hypothetical protein